MSDWPFEKIYACETFEDWEAFLATLTPSGVAHFFDDLIKDEISVQGMFNCFLAGIKRMRDMAHLGTAVTEEERAGLLKLSDCLVKCVEVRFPRKVDALDRMRAALDHSTKFYETFGNEHTRQWLYDAGFYDAYGVELKPPLDRPERPPFPKRDVLKQPPIHRRDAVRTQIEAAICLFGQGKALPALSLAGAAEDATPDTSEPHVFQMAKASGYRHGHGTPKEVATRLNELKNWLKHHDDQKPDACQFHEIEAVFMILRAATKYEAVYQADDIDGLTDFSNWLTSHPDYANILTGR